MKNLPVLLSCIAMTSFFSCGTTTGVIIPEEPIVEDTRFELGIREEMVSYTLDVSTKDGKAKLKNCSLEEAVYKVLTEANLYNKCSQIVFPRYTYIMKGKKVKSITVTGQPALYRNVKQSPTVIQQEVVFD